MGSTISAPTSTHLQYSNDFELVIRMSKELEHLLESGMGAPSGKTIGLHDKISAVQQSHGLSTDTVSKMRYLVTLRNKLVHDYEFNQLPDREYFAKSYDSVAKELREVIKNQSRRDSSSFDSGCLIC